MGGILSARWLVFAVALLVRCAVAFVFFGSVDVANSIRGVDHLLLGNPPSALGIPHLPGVQLFLWTAGILAFHTALPVGFAFKFAGCLFDAVIAALLVDGRSVRAGWLYAFAPVPILIFGIHGQWDSICFAFFIASLLVLRRPGQGSAAAAGMFFVLAAIAKPIVIPFAPLLLERKRAAATIGGMVACFAAWAAVMGAIGDPLSEMMIGHIARYAKGGVTYFGAPVALSIHQNRLLMALLPMAVLMPLYWMRRIEREDAVLAFYAFTIATCGLSAQYLMWLVPFLLLRGHERFAAVYSLLAGVFLVTFYVSPFGGFIGYNFENLGAFAPLRGAAWLTPQIADAPARLQMIRTIGDWLLPLSCIVFLVFLAMQFRKRNAIETVTPPRASLGPLAAALLLIAAATLFAFQLTRPPSKVYRQKMRMKVSAYVVESYQPPVEGLQEALVIPLSVRSGPFAATSLAYAWILIWSIATAATRRAAATDHPGP